MPDTRQWHWLFVCAGTPVGAAQAAPIEGSLFSNIAALLLVLGMGALLTGMRNLRQMRHRRIASGRSAKVYRRAKS